MHLACSQLLPLAILRITQPAQALSLSNLVNGCVRVSDHLQRLFRTESTNLVHEPTTPESHLVLDPYHRPKRTRSVDLVRDGL